MTAPAPRAVVFDLDGTLVDSRRDLAAAVNLVRGELGLAALPVETVVGMVGQGARNLVRRALGDPDRELLDRASTLFLERYEPICTERTRPYPGIPELIEALGERLPLAVLTNKPERPARRIVDSLGWKERFAIVLGGDSIGARKPDPAGLLEIARRLDLAAGDLLLIGDSVIDAETADAAGCDFAFASWGFAGAGERALLGSRRSAPDPAALRRRLVADFPSLESSAGLSRPSGTR